MARGILFSPKAWDDFLYWLEQDPSITKRLTELLKECQRDPFKGLGKPEGLRGNFKGWWSRRINDEHRLVYAARGDFIEVAQCRYHYAK